jgi:hypothetical protein
MVTNMMAVLAFWEWKPWVFMPQMKGWNTLPYEWPFAYEVRYTKIV